MKGNRLLYCPVGLPSTSYGAEVRVALNASIAAAFLLVHTDA